MLRVALWSDSLQYSVLKCPVPGVAKAWNRTRTECYGICISRFSSRFSPWFCAGAIVLCVSAAFGYISLSRCPGILSDSTSQKWPPPVSSTQHHCGDDVFPSPRDHLHNVYIITKYYIHTYIHTYIPTCLPT